MKHNLLPKFSMMQNLIRRNIYNRPVFYFTTKQDQRLRNEREGVLEENNIVRDRRVEGGKSDWLIHI